MTDRLRRRRRAIQVVATGSSALRVAAGSRESLAGRFERIVLGHWTVTWQDFLIAGPRTS